MNYILIYLSSFFQLNQQHNWFRDQSGSATKTVIWSGLQFPRKMGHENKINQNN